MGRQKLTDEERKQRREARLEKAREKRAEAAAQRESEKAAIRSEIEGLASVIPPPCPGWRRQHGSRMERRARRGDAHGSASRVFR
ncbi:TPA: hypothetical protein U2L37_000104 [Burkholderia multivorans]|nr:hypothetical protein [Burkholderia multivorans]HEM7812332.1 hypothetical protein [Burkholderia multivorans]HEM7817957.1 hypothetical protein [Burkholderia multivorans]HEM7823881.1 hypothetical protein [Burkholderia multivorans]